MAIRTVLTDTIRPRPAAQQGSYSRPYFTRSFLHTKQEEEHTLRTTREAVSQGVCHADCPHDNSTTMATAQAPMLSSPLKQTNEIDWIAPLKAYIRDTYGDDPERYNEECGMLNRLRQDMRGAGKDSASGRDLLYRYYGQLELLDLRFPVDENHIKIAFTW